MIILVRFLRPARSYLALCPVASVQKRGGRFVRIAEKRSPLGSRAVRHECHNVRAIGCLPDESDLPAETVSFLERAASQASERRHASRAQEHVASDL
ncbi:MAG: hypothetical protein EPO10_23325 [Reyranella sp.]|nr:MAG: hypothetical protein EPO10_23325 [Reyranella sp.]